MDQNIKSEIYSIVSSPTWFIKETENKSHKKNKHGPCRRWGHSSAILDGKMYIYGGAGNSNHDKYWESVYMLELNTWDWTKLIAIGKTSIRRDSHSCTILNQKLYIFGGSNGNDSLNDLSEYDLCTNTWKNIESKGNIPTPREGHSACLIENRYILIYGGWSEENTFHDCYLFDTQTYTWKSAERKTDLEPSPRESQSCCMIKDYMYVFGGQGMSLIINNRSYENFFNDLHRFKIIFDDGKVFAEWEKIDIKGKKPTKRSSHSSCAYKNRYMFIIGGEGYPDNFDEETDLTQIARNNLPSNENYQCYPKNDIWAYDTELNEWIQIQPQNEKDFPCRFAHSCNMNEDNLIVFGGLTDYAHSTKDICVLSFSGVDPFDKVNPIIKKKSAKLIHETKILCQSCKLKGQYPTKHKDYSTEESRKAAKNIKDNEAIHISTLFLHSLSTLMTWPFASFGLFIDNSLISLASKIHINYLYRTKSFFKQFSANDDFKNFIRNKQDHKNEEIPYILIQDNGIGWTCDEFLDILYLYDNGEYFPSEDKEKIDIIDESNDKSESVISIKEKNVDLNRYAINMKLGGFRLGATMIFLTKCNNIICIALITTNKKYNPNIHGHNLFYTSWDLTTNKFQTNFGQANKSIILNTISPLFHEEDLINMVKDDISNALIILDLNTITTLGQKEPNLELYPKRNSQDLRVCDLIFRTTDKQVAKIAIKNEYPRTILELSLKTYLRHLFLDPSRYELSIFFNGDQIHVKNRKSIIQNIEDIPKINLEEGELYQGIIFKTNQLFKNYNLGLKSSLSTSEKSIDKDFDDALLQGILVYYDNRLIRRFEIPKLGNLEFLIGNPKLTTIDMKKTLNFFDYCGYIEVKSILKPNFMRTEIENPYYSNYFFYTILNKLIELENTNKYQMSTTNTKRKNESSDQLEGDIISKKIKFEKRQAI